MTDIELQQLKKQDLKDFRILSKLISNKKYWAYKNGVVCNLFKEDWL